MLRRLPKEREVSMNKTTSLFIPVVIFGVMLVVMYQVNKHTQLHARMIEEHDMHADEHFVTGGRRAQMSRGRSPIRIAVDAEPPVNVDELTCHTEEHAEYHGPVVEWGDGHYKDSAEECCAACRATFQTPGKACNVWAWCSRPEGCDGRKHKECWLKQGALATVLEENVGRRSPAVAWVSGVLYTNAQMEEYKSNKQARLGNEGARLATLKANKSLPLVWMDVSLKGTPLGRVEIVLFRDVSPLASENLRRLCTGEVHPSITLKGAFFYRIVDRFIDQTGVNCPVALGGSYRDDMGGLTLKHDRKGLLSMANRGPDTNGNHFSILMSPAPHLNTHYTVFGEVVSNLEALVKVNELARGKPNNEWINTQDAQITDVGQIRQGVPVPKEVILDGLRD
ncbi:cyclophilin-type peptidyl-prolyl cis-trans isomerase [Dunaliella salina]|uniref:Cyclophilin-type peptidyl-prolyl cis-trans isomerase n=1 Tax=Dunaliella salina TaxID=3046 RepID=A0ABQ7GHZ0_DUNSA|nr:cyclophilin-type peptidyl-prolyl cis-trans isomerase [Dunaliella salina]|eukprot:KAF5834216.1 cyclophilin-type peptidyl-prolyl cis-trans isomerase [Dunaliella salina]